MGSEQPYQADGKDSSGMCGDLDILRTSIEERKSPRHNLMADLWHGFLGLERSFGNFHLRLLLRNYTSVSVDEPMWSMDQTYFKNKLVSVVLDENGGNSRKKRFHWMLNSSFVKKVYVYPLSLLVHHIVTKSNCQKNIKLFLKPNYVTNLWIKIRCSIIYNQEINTRLWSFKFTGSITLGTIKSY